MHSKYLLLILLISVLFITNIKVSKLDLKDKTITFKINVKGAVYEDYIIEVNNEMIIEDVLELIKLKDEADLSKINLSLRLYPEMVITIPYKSENKLISINSASLEELCNLPGIKEKGASNIIEYRNNNGPFLKLEDLMNVKGIGEKKYEKLKDFICL